MGQIVGTKAKPKRANLNALANISTVPNAGEYILVSSDNSMTAAGQGNFDCYIIGDGTTAATSLELKSITNGIVGEGVLDGVSGDTVYRMMRVYPDAPNLFDKTTATDNYYIDGTSLTASNSYFASDYIPVKPNTTYTFSQYINYRSFFDENKVYKSRATDTVKQITTSATAQYIRFSGPKGSGATLNGMMMVEGTTLPNDYIPYGHSEEKYALNSEISRLDNELQYGDKLSASYDSDGMTSGKILTISGGLADNSSYKVSNFIELPTNTTSLHTSGLSPNNANTYIGLVLYNSAQSNLATVCGSGQSIPEIIDVKNNYPSAKYIRYCSSTSSSPVVDIYVAGTLKDTVDELSGVKPLGNLINITESSYGNNYTNGSTYANQPLWFTHQNVASEVDGILKSVWFYAPNVGTYEFAVGILDQRNTLVNERYFSLTFETTGVHNVDVYDKEIKINKGEQVFAHFISTLKATLYNSAQTYTSLYASSATSEFAKKWTNGAISGLGWTIMSIEAPFALKSDVAQLEDKIDSLEQQSGNIGYVVSQNGEKYRMSVSNGELVLLSTQYKKVIALGNSLTNHGPKESIGWYGGAWAMAATRENTGWTQQFQRILRQKEPTATVTGVNIYGWEGNPTGTNLSNMLDSYLTNDVDCIIFRAGENAHPSNSDTWAEQIKTLLNYCITRCPNASIILSTCMWANTTKDAAIAKVATDWGLPLVYPGTSTNLERMGDYVEGSDLQLHKITDSGVANHVNDIGFLRFANRLAANIGYATLDEQHDVTVVDGGSIGYTCFSSWVANGIFNIKTTATTVTAVDANSNALTVTNHGDEFFTFVMPDTDVTITIT